MFAVVFQVFAGPGRHHQLFRLVQAGDAVLHGDAEADVLVVVIGRAASGAYDEPPVAEIVQQGGLNGQADGMMEGQLDHREAYLDALGAGGDGGPQHQRVGVGRRAVEVVLGEPDGVHTELFGQQNLVEGAVNDRRVLFRVVADRKDEGAKTHTCLFFSGMPCEL